MGKTSGRDLRETISSAFTRVEDITYVALGVLLAASALVLVGSAAWFFLQSLIDRDPRGSMVDLLDQLLLILMIVEVLYTVQVSFREHSLIAEPFLVVGLIAAIRRILILTAEFSKPAEVLEEAFRNAMYELGLLTILVLSLVFSLYLLKKNRVASAERA